MPNEPRWEVLKLILTAPDTQLDASMVEKLRALKDKPAEEVKDGLHEILDLSAHGSLASNFVMKLLDEEWRFIGGKDDDPAPWREKIGA